jgi:hypothetical protein
LKNIGKFNKRLYMKDISLHLIDIIQNSIAANANKIIIGINASLDADRLKITVSDNGIGMDKEMLSQVTSPFVTTRTTRKVGLGISLLKASAEITGGELEISSEKDKGTILKADFIISSIDRIPLGDVSETMVSAILTDSNIEFDLILESHKEVFEFKTVEIKEKLGEVPITDFEVLAWLKEFINEGIMNTFGGVLDEVHS